MPVEIREKGAMLFKLVFLQTRYTVGGDQH